MKLSPSEISALRAVRAGYPYLGCRQSARLESKRDAILSRLSRAPVRMSGSKWTLTTDGVSILAALDKKEARK